MAETVDPRDPDLRIMDHPLTQRVVSPGGVVTSTLSYHLDTAAFLAYERGLRGLGGGKGVTTPD